MSSKRNHWLRAYDAVHGFHLEETNYKIKPEVEAFLEEIVGVCRKHGMVIATESPGQGLDVKDLSDSWIADIFQAIDDRCSVTG